MAQGDLKDPNCYGEPLPRLRCVACFFFTWENGIRRNLNRPLDLSRSPWAAYPPNLDIEFEQEGELHQTSTKMLPTITVMGATPNPTDRMLVVPF